MKSEPFSGWCCSSVLWTHRKLMRKDTRRGKGAKGKQQEQTTRALEQNNNNIQKIVTIFNKLPEETTTTATTTRQQQRTNERCWWRKHKQTILCKQWKSIFLKNLHKTRQTNKPKKKRKKGPKKLINLLCYCVFYSIPARNKVREEKWNLCKNLKQRVWKSRWVETVSVFSFCLQQNTTQFATGSRGRPVHNLLRAHTHRGSIYLSIVGHTVGNAMGTDGPI